MRFVIYAALALTLVACASASKTYGPDGKEAYSLNCSGTARNWGMCMEKAGDLCGTRGYSIISATGDIGNLAVGTATTTNATMVAGSVMSRSMVIACKG
jgi:hypothetical protein